MTVVYCVNHNEGSEYVETKAAALASARSSRDAGDEYVSVTRHVIAVMPARKLACRLLQGDKWSQSRTDVPL